MTSEKSDRVLLDSEEARVTETGGRFVTTVPKRWKRRSDLKGFFDGQLEINLILDAGQIKMEIVRRKN